MRGLKLPQGPFWYLAAAVALLVSAWIEIFSIFCTLYQFIVALLVSAWIEINDLTPLILMYLVALLVSAWIEIDNWGHDCAHRTSRTPRECVD